MTVILRPDGTWRPDGNADANQVESSSSTVVSFGFRKVPWGSSRAEIKATENDQPKSESDDVISYKAVVNQLKCRAVYFLVHDQLVRAKYVVKQNYANDHNYLTAFESLKKVLKLKYGEEDNDRSYWTSDDFKDSPQEWGLAAAAGEYSRYVQWETPETRVILALSGEDYEVDLEIEYQGIEFQALEESYRNALVLEDL